MEEKTNFNNMTKNSPNLFTFIYTKTPSRNDYTAYGSNQKNLPNKYEVDYGNHSNVISLQP